MTTVTKTTKTKNKVTATQILRQLERLHTEKTEKADPHALPDAFYTEVKSGRTRPGHLRFDAIAIKRSWSQPCITGYEIKVTRSDFLRDKKWQNYQAYCHKFNFVCPVGVIRIDELPKDVGLLYYSPEHDALFEKRRAMYRKIDMRSTEIVNMLMYLVMYRCS